MQILFLIFFILFSGHAVTKTCNEYGKALKSAQNKTPTNPTIHEFRETFISEINSSFYGGSSDDISSCIDVSIKNNVQINIDESNLFFPTLLNQLLTRPKFELIKKFLEIPSIAYRDLNYPTIEGNNENTPLSLSVGYPKIRELLRNKGAFRLSRDDLIKQYGHVLGISAFTFKGVSFPTEGWSQEATLDLVVNNLKSFLDSDVIDASDKIYFKPILDIYEASLNALDKEFPDIIGENLLSVLQKRNGVFIPSGYAGHAIGVIFYDNYFIITDKCGEKFLGSVIYKLPNRSSITLETINNLLGARKLGKESFNAVIDAIIARAEAEDPIRGKPQRRGTCAFIAAKFNILPFLSVIAEMSHRKDVDIRKLYDKFTSFLRRNHTNELIRLITSPQPDKKIAYDPRDLTFLAMEAVKQNSFSRRTEDIVNVSNLFTALSLEDKKYLLTDPKITLIESKETISNVGASVRKALLKRLLTDDNFSIEKDLHNLLFNNLPSDLADIKRSLQEANIPVTFRSLLLLVDTTMLTNLLNNDEYSPWIFDELLKSPENHAPLRRLWTLLGEDKFINTLKSKVIPSTKNKGNFFKNLPKETLDAIKAHENSRGMNRQNINHMLLYEILRNYGTSEQLQYLFENGFNPNVYWRGEPYLVFLSRWRKDGDIVTQQFFDAFFNHKNINLFLEDAQSGWNIAFHAVRAGDLALVQQLYKKAPQIVAVRLASNNKNLADIATDHKQVKIINYLKEINIGASTKPGQKP